MSDQQKPPDWKQFEIAIARFLAALDPTAKVTHDLMTSDLQTGTPRQRDVWIEAKVCKQFPVKVLISCKFWSTKLDQGDIDDFFGQLKLSGADIGAIYSKAGFGENALTKAKALNISCCRLYENQPADIPHALAITAHYIRDRVGIAVLEPIDAVAWGIATWGDLFSAFVLMDGTRMTGIDAILAVHDSGATRSATISDTKPFPRPWEQRIELRPADRTARPIRLSIAGSWNCWEAKTEACLLDGSYSITDDTFVGTQMTPSIDTWCVAPGPGWKLIETPTEKPSNIHLQLVVRTDVRAGLPALMGGQDINWPPAPAQAQPDSPPPDSTAGPC